MERFSNWKIKSRIQLLVSLTIIILVSILLGYQVVHQLSDARVKMKEFEEAELARIQTNLKNSVDIAYKTLETCYLKCHQKNYIEARYGSRLKNIIDIVDSSIAMQIRNVEAGLLSLEEAQALILDEVSHMRYDSGVGYIWINDTGKPYPKMIMHPTVPALDGQILDSPGYNTVGDQKQNLFQAFVDACDSCGEGFVEYMWPKPSDNGLTEDQPKLSYVRHIEEMDWIVGTGVYIDDAMEMTINEGLNNIKQMRYDEGVGYFWINDTAEPYPTMIMHPTVPDLDGRVLNDPAYNTVGFQKQNLFQAFVDVSRESGEGFVEYMWPKPTQNGLSEIQPKESYVRLFKPLNWIIGTGVYIDDIQLSLQAKRSELQTEIVQSITVYIVIGLILMALAMVLTNPFLNAITRPISSIAAWSDNLSAGNLTRHLEYHSDNELGQLSGNLNVAVDSLDMLIVEIKNTVQMNIENNSDLREGTGKTEALLKQITHSTNTIRDQMAVLNENISESASASQQISANINSLNDQIENQASAVTESTAAVDEIMASIRSVAGITKLKKESADTLVLKAGEGGDKLAGMHILIDEITGSVDSILEMITFINKISSKTNLLAMNAAIEAAHAGEFGKGFSVVADEIRILAEATGAKAKDISQILKSVVVSIHSTSSASLDTGLAFREINDEISGMARAFSEISSVSEELADGSDQILQAMTMLNDISIHVQESSREMSTGARDVANAQEKVKDISSSVLTGINEIAEGTVRINEAMGKVNQITERVEDNSRQLDIEVNKFVTE